MKKKVLIITAVVLLIVAGCTAVFIMQNRKSEKTFVSDAGKETEMLQGKETDDKQADAEIKTTSEKTTATSVKDEKDAKTTEAEKTTTENTTTENVASSAGFGIPKTTETPEKPNVTEAPATTEKPYTTEAPATTEKPSTTQAAPAHVHKWKTIEHKAETHKEKQLVCEAYDEDVYEYHVYCNACGTYLENMSEEEWVAHVYNCESGYSSGTIKVGTIHHDAEYETVTVVDKEAWTETVCETCGERK